MNDERTPSTPAPQIATKNEWQAPTLTVVEVAETKNGGTNAQDEHPAFS